MARLTLERSATTFPDLDMPGAQTTDSPSFSEFPLLHPGDEPNAKPRGRVLVDLTAPPFEERGAYASVYRGKLFLADSDSDPLDVAVKMLRNRQLPGTLQKRFESEAKRWCVLVHPRLLVFLGTCEDHEHGALCLISPLMENGNAMQFLLRNPKTDRGALLVQVAEALHYLHTEAKVVHGDIKGDNVLIAGDGTARLADFGVTRIHEEEVAETQNASITAPSVRKAGASRFKAPELHFTQSVPGSGDLPPKKTSHADIWAYGMLIYQLFTSKAPFHELNEANYIVALSRQVRPAKTDDIPTAWYSVAQTCWAEVPKDRPTASALLKAAQKAHAHSAGGEIPSTRGAMAFLEFLGVRRWWS